MLRFTSRNFLVAPFIAAYVLHGPHDITKEITTPQLCTSYLQYKSTKCEVTIPTNVSTLHFLVSNQTQHFWHFMMGEFLPIVFHASTSKGSLVLHSSRKWRASPFDNFFDEVARTVRGMEGRQSFSIRQDNDLGASPNLILQISDRQPLERIFMKSNLAANFIQGCAWDRGAFSFSSQRALRESVAFLKTLARAKASPTTSYDLIMQLRGKSTKLSEYFRTHSAGSPEYGAAQRSVKGFNDFAQILARLFGSRVGVIDDDNLPLLDQMNPYLSAKSLVLGHGAGMVHALWMPPNSVVVELIPPALPSMIDHSLVGDGFGWGFQGLSWLAPLFDLQHTRLPCFDLSNKTSLCYMSLLREVRNLLAA